MLLWISTVIRFVQLCQFPLYSLDAPWLSVSASKLFLQGRARAALSWLPTNEHQQSSAEPCPVSRELHAKAAASVLTAEVLIVLYGCDVNLWSESPWENISVTLFSSKLQYKGSNSAQGGCKMVGTEFMRYLLNSAGESLQVVPLSLRQPKWNL